MRKLILASLTISSTLAAQSKPRTAPLHGSLERRLATLLDQPPFSRANWGVYVVGDGTYFEPVLVHPGWNAWDLNWWYAAPVSGLGFHDNSVDFHIAPGAAVDQPPTITWSPELGLFTFENRARTVPADSSTTIGDNFFRTPG